MSRTREVILLRKNVAPSKWGLPFETLKAEAEAGVDGVALTEQEANDSGHWMYSWFDQKDRMPKKIAPDGWAAFYEGELGKAFLHVQNY